MPTVRKACRKRRLTPPNMAMDKTKNITTPGGRPVTLENPPFSKVGPMDSGGDQLLLDIGNRSSLIPRTPTKTPMTGRKTLRTPPKSCIEGSNEKEANKSKDKGTGQKVVESEEQAEKDPAGQNFYYEWQSELKARKGLEQVVYSLQNQIKELEKKVALLDKTNTPALNTENRDRTNTPAPNLPGSNVNYATDEEDLGRETDWILKKNKRPSKKRKAEGSPEAVTHDRRGAAKPEQKDPEIQNGDKKSHKKERMPPPIMVHGISTFGELKNIILQITKEECKYQSLNNNIWKLNVISSEAYRKITDELTKRKIQWHSYEDKSSRPIKVMARGLHPSCDEKEIVLDLKDKGLQILKATNIIKIDKTESSDGRRTTQKRGLPLFMLTFYNQENIEKIFNIKSIMGISVKIEPLRKNTSIIPQCKRCQAFGHTQSYCNREFACVKCAGKHLTKNCLLKSDQRPKCVNCRGDHPASYRGCPIAKERQLIRKKQTNTRRQKQSKIADDKKTKQVETKSVAENTRRQNPSSYAQIVRNSRKEEENSVKDMLTLILRRLDDQDKSIKTLTGEVTVLKKNVSKPPRPNTKNDK